MGGGYNKSKFYFLIGIVFNLCLLGFFKYSDFFLENFNAFSQLLKLDFDIPLPHILLPLALSFVTFQQIAFLYDCYKSGQSGEKIQLDFIDYALFISFFPQLIAGPIVHHREMIPQFKKLGESNSSLTQSLRELEKSSIYRQQALSQSAFSTQPTNLTQDIKITNDDLASSLASHNPKNSSTILEFSANSPKSYESSSASRRLDERSEVPNTRIFSNAKGGESKGDSMESNAKSSENNPLKANAVKQSINQNNPHEVRTLKGVVGGGERLRGEGLDFAIKAPSPLAEKAMSDSKITAESRRSERAESFAKNAESHKEFAESHTESPKDSSDSKNAIDCHANPCGLSRNDGITPTVFARKSVGLTKQSIKNANFVNDAESFVESAESLKDSSHSAESIKIDCHANPCGLSRNDGESVDCHDSATPNLAMTEKGHSADSTKSTFNYEFLAKGIFIFTIGLFKKVYIADTLAKWADLGFSGKTLNLIEGWVSSLSYTFQLYFDFSGYCDMAMGLGLMFGIVLPLNFNSPYKALNIADFWRRWHISLGRFLRECVYIPLGGNRGRSNSSLIKGNSPLGNHCIDLAFSHKARTQSPLTLCQNAKNSTSITANTRIFSNANGGESQGDLAKDSGDSMESNAESSENNPLKSNAKILTLRNLFIVAILSGIWHGAGWGFVLWGLLHGVAMVIHRIYSWWLFKANSSLGNHCIDLAFSHKARTQSPLTLCQNAKNFTSITANTRILGETQGDSADSTESSENNSLKANAVKQSINKPNPHTASHLNTKHKITKSYLNFTQTRLYKCLCLILTFNFINITWVFFRAENLSVALGVLKAMFGFGASLPEKWHRMPESLAQLDGRNETIFYILIAFVLCFAFKNSFELMQRRVNLLTISLLGILLMFLSIKMFANDGLSPFLYFNF